VTMTLSLSEKANLRPFLESWRGKKFTAEEIRGFDITAVAGKPAYLNIIHETKQKNGKAVTYANIASIMPLPKGMPKPKIEGEIIIHDDDNDRYEDLPKWLQQKLDNQIDSGDGQQDDAFGLQPAGRGSKPVPAGELNDDPFDDDTDVPF